MILILISLNIHTKLQMLPKLDKKYLFLHSHTHLFKKDKIVSVWLSLHTFINKVKQIYLGFKTYLVLGLIPLWVKIRVRLNHIMAGNPCWVEYHYGWRSVWVESSWVELRDELNLVWADYHCKIVLRFLKAKVFYI